MNEKKDVMLAQTIISNIVEKLNLSVRAFAIGMGQPYSKVFDIYKGRTKSISTSIAKSISEKYGVRIEYITKGTGDMFEPESTDALMPDDDVTASFIKTLASYSNKNKALREEKSAMEKRHNEEVALLNKKIAELETCIVRMLEGKDEDAKSLFASYVAENERLQGEIKKMESQVELMKNAGTTSAIK